MSNTKSEEVETYDNINGGLKSNGANRVMEKEVMLLKRKCSAKNFSLMEQQDESEFHGGSSKSGDAKISTSTNNDELVCCLCNFYFKTVFRNSFRVATLPGNLEKPGIRQFRQK